MKYKNKFLYIVVLALGLSGCIKKGPDPNDPYESYNRKMYTFNQSMDNALLHPTAILYRKILPWPVRRGVRNVYNHVDTIRVIANDMLQLEFHYALHDTWRFGFNTVFGLLGIIDTANYFGWRPHYTDLGITFAKWGDKNSPYFVLPLWGPSTIRDGFAKIFDYGLFTPYQYIDPLALRWGIIGMYYVSERAHYLDATDIMVKALDPYAFQRDAYLQYRKMLISQTGKVTSPQAHIEQKTTPKDDIYIEEDAKTAHNTRPNLFEPLIALG